jgi:hypothetical protein
MRTPSPMIRSLRRAAVPLLVTALLVGCGGAPSDGGQAAATPATGAEQDPATPTPRPTPTPTPGPAATTPAQPCGAIENPPQQAGSHLIGDTEPPVPYSSTPPTSGWHTSGALDVTIHTESDPLSEAAQVSVLEADGVVVTYRDLGEDDVAALEAVVRERYDGQVAVTPYDRLEPGQVAFTAWGALQLCDGLDLDALEAFAQDHLGDDVTPGHNH